MNVSKRGFQEVHNEEEGYLEGLLYGSLTGCIHFYFLPYSLLSTPSHAGMLLSLVVAILYRKKYEISFSARVEPVLACNKICMENFVLCSFKRFHDGLLYIFHPGLYFKKPTCTFTLTVGST